MAGELLGTIGTLAGGAIGGIVGGPAGAVMGAKIGSAAGGLAQGAAGAISGKKASQMMPSEINPSQTRLLEEARRKARQAEMGTDAATQANVREAEQLGEATKSDITKVTGGNVGGTIDALLKAQRITGKNINSAMATGSQRAMGYNNLVSTLTDAIAQRKADLQMIKSSQARAEGAQNMQTGLQNAQAGILSSIPVSEGNTGLFGNNNAQTAPQLATNPLFQGGISSGLSSPSTTLGVISGSGLVG